MATQGHESELVNVGDLKATLQEYKSEHDTLITLNSAPTASTTQYTHNSKTYNFKIGDEVRVVDANETSGYKYYKLHNLVTENNSTTATWEEVGKDRVIGASGSNHAAGLVPDPGATAGTSKFLREDGSWQDPFGSLVKESVRVVNVSANLTNQTTSIAAGQSETVIYKNNGSAAYTVGISSSYKSPDGVTISLNCPVGGYCEVSYINISGTIYARGI